MGTDAALAKTKQELLTRHTLPKAEPMQTSQRKLMPGLSLLFHTQLLRQSSASLCHSNLGAKAEDSSPEIQKVKSLTCPPTQIFLASYRLQR